MSSITRRRGALGASIAVVLLLGLTGGQDPVVAKAKKGKPTSGGTAVAHHQDAKVLKGAQLKGLDIPEAALYDIGADAAEPTIAIDSKGNLFITASDLDADPAALNPGNQVDIMRSTNDGKSWEVVSPRVGPVKSHAVTLDPYIWMDEYTNRVYTIDLTVACAIMSWSDDLGVSWLTNPASCGRPVNDHQTLFGGPPAISPTTIYESVLYYCWNDVASSSCSKSLDGGITFSPTGTPAFEGVSAGDDQTGEPDLCGGLHGHGVVGPDGSVYLPREWCGLPMLAISRDEGLTWTQIQVSNLLPGDHFEDGKSDPSVAVDKKGNVYYTWVGGKDRQPYLSVSRDRGETWSRPMMIGYPGITESNFATIDAGDPGKVAIAYYAAENSPGPAAWNRNNEEKMREAQQKYAETTWNAYITMSDDVFAKDPVFYSARLNDIKDPIVRGRCGPGRCGRVFDFIDVEIAPDGTPWAPIVDACIDLDRGIKPTDWNCVTKPLGAQNFGDQGLVGRLIGGPRLR